MIQSMVDRLEKVLVRAPDSAFGEADPLKWHYTQKPNLLNAQKEHLEFVSILKKQGVEIVYHETPLPHHADALFVHDPVLITEKGAIILRMGKLLRRGEEEAMQKTLMSLKIPILGHLTDPAIVEGGDTLWLDSNTLCIGRGVRTNQEGINQIRKLVSPSGVEVVTVELPYWDGPSACLHLQSLISMVDRHLAVVYSKLLPVSFIELMTQRGMKLIEVPENEFTTQGPNILAIRPKVCLTLEGNEETKRRLEQEGCTVLTYRGDEISHKAEGGATCLTRPLMRGNYIL